MATANERLLDASTLHAVRLERLKNGIVRRMIAQLNRVDGDLVLELQKQLERMPASAGSVERIDQMLQSVIELNAEAFAAIRGALDGELKELAAYEVGFQQDLFNKLLPVQVSFNTVNPVQVYAAAMARPFQGVLLKEALSNVEADKAIKIRNAVRMGFIEGQTTQEIVRRIKGTRALNYADGLLDISRRNATAVVRTAVAHTADYARRSVYDVNDDIIKGIEWVSTLDSRTSAICIERSGKVYPVDKVPAVPAHWNCRSTTIPVLKSWRELGLDMDELPESTRASMDGQVPESTTYSEWLRKQPKAIQEEVLGVERAKLFRDYNVEITRFIDDGRYLTIEQLKKLDASLFE